jgi:hypothetical protein
MMLSAEAILGLDAEESADTDGTDPSAGSSLIEGNHFQSA